jgi:hypothetical protein
LDLDELDATSAEMKATYKTLDADGLGNAEVLERAGHYLIENEETIDFKLISRKKQQYRERKTLEGEDTITNHMLHWKYSKEQIAELKRVVLVKMPMENILEFFYPEASTQQMREIVDTFRALGNTHF